MIVIAAPFLLVILLGVSSLLDRKLTEQTTTAVLQAGTVAGLVAALAVLLAMLIMGTRHVPIELGDWVIIPGQYHFSIKFVFDRLSVPMAILSFTLSGTIGAFASRYMHRDVGYNRFFVLYTLFVLGMVVTSLAGTIETLFAGWELVGLSSAPPGGLFSGTECSRAERPVGLDHLPVLGRRPVAGRGGHAPPARRGRLRQVAGDGPLARGRAEPDHRPAGGGGPARAGGRRRQVGAGTILRLVAPGHGRPDSLERHFLRRALSAPGCFLLLRVSPLLDSSPLLSTVVVACGYDHRHIRLFVSAACRRTSSRLSRLPLCPR